MAITLGAAVVTGGNVSTGSTITLNITVSAGNSLVVGVAWRDNTHTISSVSCSGESNLTIHGSPTSESSGGRSVQFASLGNITSGGAKTVTVTMSANQAGSNYAVAFVAEFAGGNTSSWFDTTTGATGSSTTPTVNITTANDNSLVCGIAVNISQDPSAGSGYTLIALTDGGSANSAEYKLDAGVAGSKTVDFSLGSSQSWAIKAAAFNAVPASPTITPGVGTLSLTGVAPSVGVSYTVTPTTGALSTTGYAPTASDSSNPTIVPGTASLAITGLAGFLEYDATPAAASLAITGLAPTVANTTITYEASSGLLLHTISATGYDGPVGEFNLLTHDISATGHTGIGGTASIELLTHELTAGGNHGAEVDLLLHSLEASGVQGSLSAGTVNLLVHELSATGIATNAGTGESTLLVHVTDAAGIQENLGTLEADLALHTLETEAFSGSLGTASIEILAHSTTTVAYENITGTASITLLPHTLEAIGLQTLTETYRTWVLNLRNAALTEYDSFDFNSFAYFNGVYLAAGPGGIVVLGSADLDGAASIDARVRTGSTDYGSTYQKRVPRMYVSGEFPGDMYFRTVTSEDGERTYVLHSNGITGPQQRRVPIGKGPKSLQWQFELENVDGSDFRISRFMPYPQELGRRIK